VSKRCCPVCDALLWFLEGFYGRHVDTLGSHRKITPCTLPPWLPDDILNAVVRRFESKLYDALIQLGSALQCNRGLGSDSETSKHSSVSTWTDLDEISDWDDSE
jgi:hypothetical protein